MVARAGEVSQRYGEWGIALLVTMLTVAGYWFSMPPFDMPESAWLFLVPFLLWLHRNPPPLIFWSVVVVTGWLSWFGLLFWLRNFTSHLEFTGHTVVGWLLTGALSAIVAGFWVLWCWGARHLWRDVRHQCFADRMLIVAALAGAWVLLEWIRSWIFTGFPWLPLAASQWQRPILLQVLPYTGSWGLSWALIVFNAALSLYILHIFVPLNNGARHLENTVNNGARHPRQPGVRHWWQRLCPDLYFGLTVMVLVVAAGWLGPQPQRPQTLARAGFVQPYVQPDEKWDFSSSDRVLHDLAELTRLARILGAEWILWPEAPTPFPITGANSLEQWLHTLAHEVTVPILGGGLVRVEADLNTPERWFNAVVLVSPDNGLEHQHIYAKRRLVPFGEYIPMARWLPFLNTVVPLEGSLHPGRSPALIPLRLSSGASLQVGPLVCYEDIFSHLARSSVRAGADILFVATNNAWYGEEGGAWQHAAHSVLRAAETRRPLLRSGNGGWSGWIDEYGRIRHVMLNEQGSIYFSGADTALFQRDPAWSRKLTLYVRLGPWWVGISTLMLFLAIGRLHILRRAT